MDAQAKGTIHGLGRTAQDFLMLLRTAQEQNGVLLRTDTQEIKSQVSRCHPTDLDGGQGRKSGLCEMQSVKAKLPPLARHLSSMSTQDSIHTIAK